MNDFHFRANRSQYKQFPLKRHRFLQLLASAFALPLMNNSDISAKAKNQSKPFDKLTKWRGVNLGGWLLLEKWMTPSLFEGTGAIDEHTFSQLPDAKARLQKHRDTFIVEDDFRWIAEHGLNSVRLPVGHWILEATAPYHAAPERLDWAFDLAEKYSLGVLLDLHGAPGSQNGMDHSGKIGPRDWDTNAEHRAQTIRVLESLAERYASRQNLIGLQFLNEPHWDMPLDVLKKFYLDAYPIVRKHLPKERVAIVIHDGFRPFEWKDFMTEPEYSNVILDTHMYQCFSPDDRTRNASQQIVEAANKRATLDGIENQLWAIVGEWSLALPPESYAGLDAWQRDIAKRAYGAAQLLSFDSSHGWFYWSYKVEDPNSDWNFRASVERGTLPAKFDL
jgi:glucan 1,3-beta-glucosidase